MGGKSVSRIGLRGFCIACLLIASEAQAARQGSLSAVSTGTVGISASIAPQARMSGPRDIAFGNAGTVSQNLCLSSNSLARSYTLAAVGSGDAGAFKLSNGGETIGYTVGWASSERMGPSENGGSMTQLRAALVAADCQFGRGSAAFVVAIDAAHLDQVETGPAFTGTLTLMVAPE